MHGPISVTNRWLKNYLCSCEDTLTSIIPAVVLSIFLGPSLKALLNCYTIYVSSGRTQLNIALFFVCFFSFLLSSLYFNRFILPSSPFHSVLSFFLISSFLSAFSYLFSLLSSFVSVLVLPLFSLLFFFHFLPS